MNKWSESLGCEVNDCRQPICTAEFVPKCYLRKCYKWRVQGLKLKLKRADNEISRQYYRKELQHLGVEVTVSVLSDGTEASSTRADRNREIKTKVLKLISEEYSCKDACEIVGKQFYLKARQVRRIYEETLLN